MSALLMDAVFTGGRVQLADEFLYRTVLKKLGPKWGQGAALKVRIEPEGDAWRHSDVKHLFGHVYGPVLEFGETGYTKTEFHVVMKGFFMPEGKGSLLDLNREELRDYTLLCEQYLREKFPDCFESQRAIA